MNSRIRRVRSLEARAQDRQFEMVRRAFAGRSIEELEFFAEHGWWPAPEDLPASVTPIRKAMTREEWDAIQLEIRGKSNDELNSSALTGRWPNRKDA